jgi:hypothetical protein
VQRTSAIGKIVDYLSYGRSPLHTEGCLIVTLLKSLSRVGKKEHTIPFYEIIQVHCTVLSGLSVRHDDHLYAVMVQTGHDEPPG